MNTSDIPARIVKRQRITCGAPASGRAFYRECPLTCLRHACIRDVQFPMQLLAVRTNCSPAAPLLRARRLLRATRFEPVGSDPHTGVCWRERMMRALVKVVLTGAALLVFLPAVAFAQEGQIAGTV